MRQLDCSVHQMLSFRECLLPLQLFASLIQYPHSHSQIQEAPKPIDDEALLEYQRRIDKILEETAE